MIYEGGEFEKAPAPTDAPDVLGRCTRGPWTCWFAGKNADSKNMMRRAAILSSDTIIVRDGNDKSSSF
jgi:hypothetical protein